MSSPGSALASRQMWRAALYSTLVLGISAGWLMVFGAGCVLYFDGGIALLGVTLGSVAALGFAAAAVTAALSRWWDARRSRAWRL